MSHVTSAATPENNPLLRASELPYGLRDFAAIETAHYLPAFDVVEAQVAQTLAAITQDDAPATFENTVEPLERDHIAIERVLTPLFTLTGADTTPELQELEDQLAPRLAQLGDSIELNSALLARLQQVRENDDLTPEQRHIVERRIKDMTLAGAALGDAAAERVRAINSRLASLGSEFDRRLLADTVDLAVVEDRAELDGLSDAEIEALARPQSEGGGYVVSLTYPTGHPYLAPDEPRAA